MDHGQEIEGGMSQSAPRPRFLLFCACVGAARLSRRKIKRNSKLWAFSPYVRRIDIISFRNFTFIAFTTFRA